MNRKAAVTSQTTFGTIIFGSSKKTISPVVATTLLLVVAVVSVVGFQGWFGTYQSGMLADVEGQSSVNSQIRVEGIVGDTLYLKSGSSQAFSMFKIVDSDGNIMCEVKDGVESDLLGDTKLLLTFDDGTATDLSGYGNNGVLNGGVDCTVNGVSGNGCSFDGIDDFIRVLDMSDELNGLRKFSVSLGVNFNEIKGDNVGNNYTRIFVFNTFPESWFNLDVTDGVIELEGGTAGSCYFTTTTNYSLSYNEDYFITIVVDIPERKTYYYINGNLHDERIQHSSCTTGLNLTGALRLGFGGGGDNGFNGTLDEFAVYSKALTSSEVKALHNSNKAKFYEQIIGEELKEIDVSNCNLNNDEVYNFVGFTENGQVDRKVIAK